jgi:hypothetical protein
MSGHASELIMREDEYAKIINRERGYLGFGPEVTRMSDLDVLRKGVARTRSVMRRAMKHAAAKPANDALIQFNRTQLAFNRARMLTTGE